MMHACLKLPSLFLFEPDGIEVSLHLDIYFISIGTWVLFVNNVRKFVVCASIELECCSGRLQRLLVRINSTERSM